MSKKKESQPEVLVTDRRRSDRRKVNDRRQKQVPVATERRGGRDRREEEGERRRQIDPTTCERDYSDAEVAFMTAMDDYKRFNRRPFPTWSEVLEVLHALGYRLVEKAIPIPGAPGSKK